ncbi:hypothetical protein pb186bvf_010138 [Paramecium bursaria]
MFHERWPLISKNLRSEYLKYFLDIQDYLEEMQNNIEDREMIDKIIFAVSEILSFITQVVDLEHHYLIQSFEKGLHLFRDIDPNDKLHQFEIITLLQELFSKVAMTHFQSEQPTTNFDKIQYDGSSTCSDFSDDNFDVEDFEAKAATEIFTKIRECLNDEEIMNRCQQFQFTVFEKILNLSEFFEDGLGLKPKDYDIIMFLNFSGMLKKMINFNGVNQLEYFVQQLQYVLAKIRDDDIEEIIDTNLFEMKYSRLSQRKFMKCTLLSEYYARIIQEKLDRWRSTQTVKEIQGQNLKELRRFILEHKAPLSRWEVSILSIQDVEFNQENLFEKFQKLVIALQASYEQLIETFLDIDKLYVTKDQFNKWIKLNCLPLTLAEINDLFDQASQPYGYYTTTGVKVVQRLDFHRFLNKVFNIQTPDPDYQYKYSDEITQYEYNKHLHLKLVDLKERNEKLQNEYHEVVDHNHQLQFEIETQRQREVEHVQSQEVTIRQDISHQNEILNLQNQYDREKKLLETKWKAKTKQLLYELEQKDKQIEQYRAQLEALIKELDWVKTERQTHR